MLLVAPRGGTKEAQTRTVARALFRPSGVSKLPAHDPEAPEAESTAAVKRAIVREKRGGLKLLE